MRAHADTPAARLLNAGHLEALERLRLGFIFDHGTMGGTLGSGAGRFGLRRQRGRPPARFEEAIAKSSAAVAQAIEARRKGKRVPRCRAARIDASSRKDCHSF